MTAPLWRLLLVTNFGRGARRPLRAAAVRLATAAAAGLALGLALARVLEDAPLPDGLPTPWLAAAAAAAAFGITGLAFLSLAAATQHQGASRLTAVMPIGRGAQFALELAPLLLAWALGLTVAVPVMLALGSALDAPALPLLAAALAGSLGGLGAVLLRPASVILKALLIISLMLLCGRLLTIYIGQFPSPHAWPLLALTAALTITLAGYPLALAAGHRYPASAIRSPAMSLPCPALIPGWYLLKLLRNRRTLIALLFSLTVSFAAAALVAARHLAAAGGPSWLLLGAILAAALACDARGLSPRRPAPEIESLHGPTRFIAAETLATLSLCLILGLPMLTVLIGAHVASAPALIAAYIALQTAAALTGLLASTIFVPASGDLGSQFFAAALATTALLAVPKVLHLPDHSLALQSAAWLSLAAACFASIAVIERQRRLT